jgi:hypothetical protein
MATPLKPKIIRNLGIYGIIREAEVTSSLIPDGAVTEAVNVQFDSKGAIAGRLGITTLGSTIQAGYPIFGIHNSQNGSMFAAISQGGSMRVYAFPSGGAWTSSLTGGSANIKVRFLEAGGRTIALNFGNASNMYSSVQFLTVNDAWVTTGTPINPQAITDDTAGGVQPQYGEVFKSRIYLAGGNTNGNNVTSSRLWYSNVVNSAGEFNWTPSTDWVDINPNDGENITGLKRYSLELLVFKPNYIYRFRTSSVDPDPLIKIGTRSNESIIEGKKGLYFHHDSGFYRYTGGYPTEISRPISDIVDAIPFSQYDDISSWKDGDHIYWSLGNLTLNGEVWTKCVARYTESSDLWTIYSYPNEIKFASQFNSGSALSRVVGLDNGVVATFNSGTTDLGEPIKYRVVTKWMEMGSSYDKKVIQELVAICDKAQGAILMYQIDDKDSWETIGQLKKFLTKFNSLSISFYRIRFKLTGLNRNEAIVFKGIEIIKGLNEGNI